jgi:SprT protein
MLRSVLECKAGAELALERLCKQYNIVMPRVTYGLRGKSAGVSYDHLNWIEFNLFLFRENFDEFINQVVPHELCHAWQDQLKLKGRPHGKEWKGLMARMGLVAERTHNFCVEFSLSRTGLFRYRCNCNCGVGHMVGLEMHREMEAHPLSYRCEKCGRLFVYVNPPPPARRR